MSAVAMNPRPNAMLEAALRYGVHGWRVLPLVPGDKKPLITDWPNLATADLAQIFAWWTQWADANIGIATGAASGISVLDVDVKEWEGKHGDKTLRALTEQHGALPDTPLQVTWSGGFQYVFAYETTAKQGANCYGADLDGRNDGGYIVAPPSRVSEITVDGPREGNYCWFADPASTPLAEIPAWLLELALNGSRRGSLRPVCAGSGVAASLRAGKTRNVSLTSIAGGLRAKGLEPAELEPALAAINEATGAHLPEKEVATIARSMGRYEPTESTEPGGERYTDMMNAERLAEVAHQRAAYVSEMKDRWYTYRDGRLLLEPASSMVPFVKELAKGLFERADQIDAATSARIGELENGAALAGLDIAGLKKATADTHDPRLTGFIEQLDRAAEMRKAAKALEGRTGCYNTIEMAKAQPRLQLSIDQLDQHPTWLNTPTGTLDLDTGDVHEHRFTDSLTKVSGAAYDPTATCPLWEAFLAEVIPDPKVRAFLRRCVGYALTDRTDEQCMFFLYGKGRNGKTTFINTLRSVLGDYAASTQASTLMVKPHGDDKRNDLAALRGARFVSIIEAEEGQQMAEALLKQLTGEDSVTARFLYAEFFSFTPTFKIFLAANHKPLIRGTDLAIWRRIHLVPFTETIPMERVDPALKEKLAAEGPGILNWAIAGYEAYRAGGLQPPQAVLDATKDYREEMDTLAGFLADKCLVGPGASATTADIYRAYKAWADEQGIRHPLNQKQLGLQLQDRGFDPGKGAQGIRVWRGLRLKV